MQGWRELGPWFHNLHLPDGSQTAPDHPLGDFPSFKWKEIEQHIPQDLTGWSVLDVGCNAGFYSIELAKRGATVLGIDLDPLYLRQAEWAAKTYGLDDRITLRQMQVYDVARLEQSFDLVWYMGVMYHLRYPLLSLDILSEKVRRMMVFQTLTMPSSLELEKNNKKDDTRAHTSGRTKKSSSPVPEDLGIFERARMLEESWPKMAFIENKLAGDPTNWWAPNDECIQAMLRSCGLEITSRPGHEIYVCTPQEALSQINRAWNRSEYLSAIGAAWQDHLKEKVGEKTVVLSSTRNGHTSKGVAAS